MIRLYSSSRFSPDAPHGRAFSINAHDNGLQPMPLNGGLEPTPAGRLRRDMSSIAFVASRTSRRTSCSSDPHCCGTRNYVDVGGLQHRPAPDFRDKIWRALWRVVNTTVYRIVPTPLFGPRRIMLRLFGAQIAGDALPYPGVTIWAPWNLVMHGNSCMANGVICYNVARITIGKDATVSYDAYFCSPSHNFRNPNFPLVAADITIEASAWIATDAFIGLGVIVGS